MPGQVVRPLAFGGAGLVGADAVSPPAAAGGDAPELLDIEVDPHTAHGGRPPVSRTNGSGYRLVFDQPPEPLIDVPQQLTFEDFV